MELISPSARIPHPPLISRSDAEEQSLEAALAAALSHTIAEFATLRLLACLPSRAKAESRHHYYFALCQYYDN